MPTLESLETKKNKKIVELASAADGSAIEHSAMVGATTIGGSSIDSQPSPVTVWCTGINGASNANSPISGFNAAIKRLCDFVIGGIALIVLMPLLVLLSILIKLDSNGPALFSQQRQGRNRETIKVYKFRTMYQDYSTPVPTSSSFKQTQKDDLRITRIGGFLRKASLDELPQLFNVLQGSMSLVGPRPHPAPLDEQFQHIIPTLNSRYAVKPGLTGWAQIHGFRGETKRIEDMVARVEHDRHYIKNWTLWLDIKIIAITAIKGWIHHNAY